MRTQFALVASLMLLGCAEPKATRKELRKTEKNLQEQVEAAQKDMKEGLKKSLQVSAKNDAEIKQTAKTSKEGIRKSLDVAKKHQQRIADVEIKTTGLQRQVDEHQDVLDKTGITDAAGKSRKVLTEEDKAFIERAMAGLGDTAREAGRKSEEATKVAGEAVKAAKGLEAAELTARAELERKLKELFASGAKDALEKAKGLIAEAEAKMAHPFIDYWARETQHFYEIRRLGYVYEDGRPMPGLVPSLFYYFRNGQAYAWVPQPRGGRTPKRLEWDGSQKTWYVDGYDYTKGDVEPRRYYLPGFPSFRVELFNKSQRERGLPCSPRCGVPWCSDCYPTGPGAPQPAPPAPAPAPKKGTSSTGATASLWVPKPARWGPKGDY